MISFKELLEQRQIETEEVYDLETMYKSLEKMSQRLVELEKSKNRFLSLVRNSFDNPLFGMVLLQNQLRNSLKEKGDIDNYNLSNLIYGESLTLNFQLSNILAVAEVETGLLEKNFGYFNIEELLEDIFNALEYLCKEKSFKIVKRIDITDNKIYNDRDKLYIILINLIANALQFSISQSEIVIEIAEDDNMLYLVVMNNGDEVKEKQDIFDAFYQESQGFNREYQGLGIGLSVTKAFVNFLGGDIFVTRDGTTNIFVANIPNSKDEHQSLFGNELDSFMFD